MNDKIKTITAKARLNIADGTDEDRKNIIVWNLDNIIRERFCTKDCLNFKKNISICDGPTYVHYFSRCFSNSQMKCVGVDLEKVVHTKKRIPDKAKGYEVYGIFNSNPQYNLTLNNQMTKGEAVLDEVGLMIKFENIIYEFVSSTSEILGVEMEYTIEGENAEKCQFDRTLK